jgi:hypothetical protein
MHHILPKPQTTGWEHNLSQVSKRPTQNFVLRAFGKGNSVSRWTLSLKKLCITMMKAWEDLKSHIPLESV